jgi:hypothetical protein
LTLIQFRRYNSQAFLYLPNRPPQILSTPWL